jgi:hypothetical protein
MRRREAGTRGGYLIKLGIRCAAGAPLRQIGNGLHVTAVR